MTAILLPQGRQKYFDENGLPLAGGKVWTYAAGTSTPKVAYRDEAGTPQTNPVILDAKGEATIFWDGAYKVNLLAADDTQITGWPVDNLKTDPLGFAAALTAAVAAIYSDFSNSSNAAKGDALVAVKQPLTGAQGRTQHEKNFDIKSFSDFCPTGKTFATMTTAESFAAVQAAWTSALATPHDLMNWGETIDIGDENFPWQQATINPATLLDCKNVTIHGVGPSSVFKTTSAAGADVFQLNGLKNFHARNLKITAALTGSLGSGSNGISVTGGYDNITLLDIYCENLPGLDKGASTDGGDALSIQSSAAVAECGTLVARIYAKGCMRGFNVQPGLSEWLTKKPAVVVDIVAEDCYQAVVVSAAGASAAVPAGMQYGIRVNATAVNCQHDLVLARAHGGEFNVEVVTSKTAAARRINPVTSAAWFAADTIVDSLLCTYAKNAGIVVYGNKGACDYKARIGGASAGSSGLNGATEYCDITFDVGGTAATADLLSVDSGGNTLRSNRLDFSTVTVSALPAGFTAISNANRILWGSNYTGSATLTLTGCTTSPTGSISYSLNGDTVTINFPDITGTSDTTGATLTGLPAEIQPAGSRVCVNRIVDNGTEKISLVDITGGTLTLFNGPGSFTFTNTGTKGIKSCSLTYKR